MPISPWQKRAWRLWLALPVLFCAACGGGGFNEVQGTVLYQGKPIKGAVVLLHAKDSKANAQVPSGVTGEDGTFTLMTGIKNGVPVGDYNVAITWPAEAGSARPKPGSMEMVEPDQPDRLKGRYGNASTSTLSVSIKSGANKLEPFDLK